MLHALSLIMLLATALPAYAEPTFGEKVADEAFANADRAAGASIKAKKPGKLPDTDLASLAAATQSAYDGLKKATEKFRDTIVCANDFRGTTESRATPNAAAQALLKKYADAVDKNFTAVKSEIAVLRAYTIPVPDYTGAPMCGKSSSGSSSVLSAYYNQVFESTQFFFWESSKISKLGFEISPYYERGDPGVKRNDYLRDRFAKEFLNHRTSPNCAAQYNDALKAATYAYWKYGSSVLDIDRNYTTPFMEYFMGQRRVMWDAQERCQSVK